MNTEIRDTILSLERRFWTDGLEFYERHLASAAMMVLPPPAGVMDRTAVLASMREAPRWERVAIEATVLQEFAPDVVGLAYRATAHRSGAAEDYRALAGSVYRRNPDGWQLIFHQQTPRAGD